MSSLSIRSFTLFREEQPVRDALVLFTLTLLLHFLGAMLRLVQELSFFWPLNAVMAGIFARYVWLNRSYFYAVCFAAMLVYDGLTSRWGMGFASLLINFSNIVFIVTLAQLVLWDKRRADSMPGPINALNLFCFCLLAALLCAAVGALGSVDVERATFVPQLADWFSEQFSTAVLILPFILTLTLPSALSGFRFRQLLPVLALVMLQAGSLTRYVRASMLDVVKMDFIRTARAKGLQERTVILKHALRNALLPIITLLGFELPGLFSGAIITEKVFNWPGAGHIHIDSLAARDYPVLMGFTLFLAVLTIVGNLLADVLYAWADPRIRVRS
ncbi:ABC transporter permease subunit [Klebsiella pneumoniae]|uniref:ABC transporter permease subunit n=14 Tax=Enterobacteriaceae TaxID=543 RepID=UPI001E5AA865|nr:ABC transporter permease [Klebsiella pneumoniae]